MTKEQFQEIKESLSKWREQRGLTIEGQKEGLLTNLLEEFREFLLAQDDLEKVDALCDCAVLLINADSPNLKSVYPHWMYISLKIELESVWMQIKKTGFDPYIAMQETIKELNSRKGEFDSSINKFVKSLGAYTFEEAREKSYQVAYFARTFNISEWLLISEDDSFWVFGCSEDEHPSWHTIVKKWYKADYEKARMK